jgi:hypothetical protein
MTAKFTLTADFETVQAMRHLMADQTRQAVLVSLLGDTLAAYLVKLVKVELAIETQLKVSQKRAHRSGPRAPIPVCQDGLLAWHDVYEGLTNQVGRVGSQAFMETLQGEGFKSFRYISSQQMNVTVYRRRDGKWYASKRLAGQFRRRYVGQPEKMTVERLDQIAFDLSQGA